MSAAIARVYYRSRDGKLHAFNTYHESPEEAFKEVMKELHETKEVFKEPLLYVIDGKGIKKDKPKERA